jgi:Holliday junction resolvase RusA-like endonuclease
MKISFEIWGIPKGQGRPRSFLRRGTGGEPRIGVYDPKMSRDWKDLVLRQVQAHRPPTPFEGPVRLDLVFVMPVPKSFPKRQQRDIAAGRCVYHTKRPDRDQLEKGLMDMLQHAGFFADDAQVATGDTTKIYGVRPGVRVVFQGADGA